MWIEILVCDYCLEEISSRGECYNTGSSLKPLVACEYCYAAGVAYE